MYAFRDIDMGELGRLVIEYTVGGVSAPLIPAACGHRDDGANSGRDCCLKPVEQC